jgi:hypothetical protein
VLTVDEKLQNVKEEARVSADLSNVGTKVKKEILKLKSKEGQ